MSWSCRPAGVAGGDPWSCGGCPGVAAAQAVIFFYIRGMKKRKSILHIMVEVGSLLGLQSSNGCDILM